MTDRRVPGLLEHLLNGPSRRRVGVIGLSKNAGKTVTFNHLVREATTQGVPLGLISTGRDGEQQDAITELPKPRIWAPVGTWLATAAGALPAATAQLTTVRELPIQTRFGPMLIGQVTAEGEVLLIGPGSKRRITEALGALEGLGAQLCLVDGSFDRIAAASPEVTGQVVLAAGAAYSTSMEETVTQVRHVLDIFDLPAVLPAIEAKVNEAAEQGPVSVVTLGGTVTPVPVTSALADPEPIVRAALDKQAYGAYLVINGALSDRLVTALLKQRARTVGLVVSDATHVLVERSLWRRWRRQGGPVYVRRPIRLVAVTINPHSPVGEDYDPQAFFQAVRAVANRPVYDLKAGWSEA